VAVHQLVYNCSRIEGGVLRNHTRTGIVQFGEFEVDATSGELRRGGRRINLQEQPFRLLTALLEQPGKLVTREDLRKVLWTADTFVDFDRSLNTAASKLRDALGDTPDNPRYIQTLPRRGYRFIYPIAGPTSQPPYRTARTILNLIAAAVLGAAIVVGFWLRGGHAEPFRVKRITSVQALEYGPAFSPDGNFLAYYSLETGNWDIFVRHLSSDQVIRLTTDAASDVSPVFSPDGASLAFARRVPGVRASAIIIVPSVGGPERILAQTKHELEPGYQIEPELDYDPTGTVIAGSCDAVSTKATAICKVPLDGGPQRTITSPPDGQMDWSPRFSPDGKKLAFARWSSITTAHVYTLTLATGSLSRVTTEPRIVFGLSWTPDGREIIIGTFRGLERVPEHGGKLRRFVDGLSTDPRITGRRLAYCEQLFDRDIWLIEMEPNQKRLGARRKFIYSTQAEANPDISPDGKRIVFASGREAFLHGEIWTANRDGSQQVRITPAGFGSADRPRWSPDGKRILFDVYDQDNSDIYVINSDGSGLRRLISHAADDSAPAWSLDGNTMYFTSNRTGIQQIWRTSLDGGPEIQVTNRGGRDPRPDRDGRFIYYLGGLTQPPAELRRVPVTGGPETPVNDGGAPIILPALSSFAPVLGGLYFVRISSTTSEFELRYLNDRTQRSFALGDIPATKRHLALGLEISPDRREVLYLPDRRHESDIVVLENFR
jgi:Tol biopolymer transport system component/DNA-binding winged helix-turn-helix (wHTH) protein